MTVWNLLLTLNAPASAGPDQRRAAAAQLGAWLVELLPAPAAVGLVEELDPDGVPVSLLVVDWLPGDHDPTPAAHATQAHLDQQIPHHPATAGWSVTTSPELDPAGLPDDTAALAGAVLDAAAHCTALPVTLLAQAYSDEFPDPDLPLAAIRGSLIVAANWVADELLNDADALAHGGTIEDTSQLVNLPPQFEPHYTPGFARQFLVAFLDLSARLTADQWTPPSCVAQELGVRLLLDQATGVADLAGIALPSDWPDTLAELLLEDTDHEYLYDPALDGFEDDPTFGPPGMTSMRVQDWFTHFPGHPPLPPYLI